MPKSKDVVVPKPLVTVAIDMATSGETDVSKFVKEISLNDEEIVTIEQETRKQHYSQEWKNQRYGRITASIFHRVSSKVRNISKIRTQNH